jgi:hypothetical protein
MLQKTVIAENKISLPRTSKLYDSPKVEKVNNQIYFRGILWQDLNILQDSEKWCA